MKKTFTNMGSTIKRLRESRELSQTEFLKLCCINMTHQFLGVIERGKANMPIKKQVKIAKVFDAYTDIQSAAVCDFMDNYNRETSQC